MRILLVSSVLAAIDTSHDPTHGLAHALRLAARLLEAEQACSSLRMRHVTSCRLLSCCALTLSYVYRVCGSQLAVCFVSCLCLCVAHACRHHLSSVHPYRVGVQSEPGCSFFTLST